MAQDEVADSSEIEEHLYKVLVVGDFGVGKTSIIRRYTEGVFSPNYKLTIGVDFALKSLTLSKSKRINLQLWDIAGHERFGHMTRVYYKYAIAAIIVFDLTRQVTFDSVSKWLKDVNQKVVLGDDEPVPILLLANKCDLQDTHQVEQDELEEFCTKNKLAGWFPTSAKTNTNIDEAMSYLVEKIVQVTSDEVKRDAFTGGDSDAVDLVDGPELIQMDRDHTNGHIANGGKPPNGSNCCV